MRRKEQEIKDKKVIKEILTESKICRIAIMDKNIPYIIPMNYGYSNNCLYMHSAPSGKKIDLLKHSNKVCFEIDYASEIIKNDLSCDWLTKYRSLIGSGTIEIITDTEQKKQGLNILMAQHGKTKNNVYKEEQVKKIVILKLKIEQLTGKQLGDWEEKKKFKKK